MQTEKAGCVHCTILGDGMVGKTCIALTYLKKTFSNNYISTVIDHYSIPVKVGEKDYIVELCDTAGELDFQKKRQPTYKGSDVIVLCFSVCDLYSFGNILDMWIPEVKRYTQKCPIILVATQTDLRKGRQGEISQEEGVRTARIIGAASYLECSSKRKHGLQEVFENIVRFGMKHKKRRNSVLRYLFCI